VFGKLVSGSTDGKPDPAGNRWLKIFTKGHFVIVWREPGVPQEMKSQADSLAAFRHTGSGGGTYTVQGTRFTQKLDYFSDPAYVGKAFPFACRRRATASISLAPVWHLPGLRRRQEASRHQV